MKFYQNSAVQFLLNVGGSELLFQCGFSRSVQHFLTHRCSVWRPTYKKPLISQSVLCIQPKNKL